MLHVVNCFHKILRQLIITLIIVVIVLHKASISVEIETSTLPQTTTIEPDASPGCKAPDIRLPVYKSDGPTDPPSVRFGTTLGYMPEDFATDDIEFVDGMNIDLVKSHFGTQMSAQVSPYQVNMNRERYGDTEQNDEIINDYNVQERRKSNKKRRTHNRRQHQHQLHNNYNIPSNESSVINRYKRQLQMNDLFNETNNWNYSKAVPGGHIYYMSMQDILESPLHNNHIQLKLYKIKNRGKVTRKILRIKTFEKNINDVKSEKLTLKRDNDRNNQNYKEEQSVSKSSQFNSSNHDDIKNENVEPRKWYRRQSDNRGLKIRKKEMENFINVNNITQTEQYQNDKKNISQDDTNVLDKLEINEFDKPPLWRTKEVDDYAHLHSISKTNVLKRVKRKSGKTTGALSRPKGGSDTSSKTSTRKDKSTPDEERDYSPTRESSAESEEEQEEEEQIDKNQKFREVSEIQFPGEIGPLGDLRLCKLRCINGKWMGPLCATNEEDKNGNVKFQPLYKSCHVQRIPQYLLLSYRNISVNVGWDVPHGHSLQARCEDLGMYKLLGESRVLCSDGLWAPRMPSCVPTTLLTNFSDDSAPSIQYRIFNGSGSFEPSGVLAVLPHSSIFLDCIYPRSKGIPEWTWTSWYMQYSTGWAHEDRNLRYRLTIRDIENGDTGTFTCTSPRGLTNSISIVVATSTCPRLPVPPPPLILYLEGNKLGQHAMYRCPPGFRVDGVANVTCLASGNWSSKAPTCHAVQCPRLTLNDPHLSVVELNNSAWGRIVFKCQWGFKLNGPPTLQCEPTGVWSGLVPKCKAIQCPMPVAPLNGRIGGTNVNQRRFTVGALITFTCNEGHILVGESSIICTESGFWSHPPPFCKSQCPYPGDPPNGLLAPLKFSYDSGDYINVQCRPGYVQFSENGPPERPKCLPDGNWSGPVPKCRSYEDV